MNRRMVLVSCMLGIALFLCALSSAEVQTKKTVLDHYLALPDEYFYCEISKAFSKEAKEKLITKKNIPNGYILSRSEDYNMEVALFKDRAKNRDIIGISIRCGAGCMCDRFVLLEPTADGKWINAQELFPSEDAIEKAINAKGGKFDGYEVALPETGTTIQLVDMQTQRPLINIFWKDGKFTIK